MFDDLVEKAQNWTPALADDFHNSIPRVDSTKGGYIWLSKDNGFYHWGPDAVDFYRHDGKIFSVQKKWLELDWQMHNVLYRHSVSSQEFRISKPIIHKYINIDDEQWSYTEIQYPGQDIGYPSVFTGLLQDSYIFIKQYIDDVAILVKYFHLLNKEFNCGYPGKVKPGNRIEDEFGFFWKDIKFWNNSWEHFLDKHVGEVQKAVTRAVHNNAIKSDCCLAEYAAEQYAKYN